MKVGIVTVYDSSNIGSYLQALAMQEVVKQNGDTPYIIRTRSEFGTLCVFLGCYAPNPIRDYKIIFRFIKNVLSHPFIVKERIEKYKKYKIDRNGLENIISVRKANQLNLDTILLGSDEIWNVNVSAFRKKKFYGKGISAKQKNGFAVSMGEATTEDFKDNQQIVDCIKKLDNILIRDAHTGLVLDELGVSHGGKICDPTLLTDITRLMQKPQRLNSDERYIAVYSYYVGQQMQEKITTFAKKNGLKTVAVSLPQKWCDEYCNCTPLEFGAVMQNADYVFTSTFHGTIFSLLYHTQCIVCSDKPKVKDVLELLDFTDAIVDVTCTQETFEAKWQQNYNYESLDRRLEKIQQACSMTYQEVLGKGR